MAAKPRVVEYGSDIENIFGEAVVDDAVLPVGRFAVEGTATGEVTLAGQGVRALGVSMESMGGRAAAYTGDFQDYAIGDTVKVCYKAPRYVLIESETQPAPAAELDDVIVSSANGKAEIGVAASGDIVAGTHPTVVTYDGVDYYRFIPAWTAGEVL